MTNDKIEPKSALKVESSKSVEIPMRALRSKGIGVSKEGYVLNYIEYEDGTGYRCHMKSHFNFDNPENILEINKTFEEEKDGIMCTKILKDELTEIELEEAKRDFAKYFIKKKISRRPFRNGI